MIRVSESFDNSNSELSMQEFNNLFKINALNLSIQASFNKINQLTMTVTGRKIPYQNDERLQKPWNIDAFFVIISEAKIQIDFCKKLTREI